MQSVAGLFKRDISEEKRNYEDGLALPSLPRKTRTKMTESCGRICRNHDKKLVIEEIGKKGGIQSKLFVFFGSKILRV